MLIDEFSCNVEGDGFSLLLSTCVGVFLSETEYTLLKQKTRVLHDKFFYHSEPIPIPGQSIFGKEGEAVSAFVYDTDDTGVFLHSKDCVLEIKFIRTLFQKHKFENFFLDDESYASSSFLKKVFIIAADALARAVLEPLEFDVDFTLHIACYRGDIHMVRALINDLVLDINATADDHLDVAARAGQQEVVLALIKEFGCDVDSKVFKDGGSILHYACFKGNVGLATTLIDECSADIHLKNSKNYTPLQLAALKGATEVVLSLGKEDNVEELRTVMYYACIGGHCELVEALLSKHESSLVTYCSNECYTPINVAVVAGNNRLKYLLSKRGFGDVNNEFLLHSASRKEDINLVRALIQECGLDTNAPDDNMNTPLHVAALAGKKEVVLALIEEFSCDVDSKGFKGRSVLHCACIGGNLGLVRALICDIKMELNERDHNMNLPLHVAALAGKQEVALASIKEFGCDVNSKGFEGRSILHSTCIGGNLGLVRALIFDIKVELNERDHNMNLSLHVAALAGKQEVALALIKEFACDVNSKGFQGRSVLHSACSGGSLGLVRALMYDIKVEHNERDHNMNLPLHVAALAGNQSVVLALLSEFACDVNSKGQLGRSVLHTACGKGHAAVVEALCKFLPPLVFDDNGDTPLHICASRGHAECVKILLKHNAPILIRNSTGQSPKDVAKGDTRILFQQHLRETNFIFDYEVVLQHARKTYSKPERITRVFVVGNPGVGKSTLIEALKRDYLFGSFRQVSESSVPPHTAGIVPSMHPSKRCGRILFYDFAGDSEYYSSHAAILENFASTKKGDNIFIVVVDSRANRDEIQVTLNYWVSFIEYQRFQHSMPYLIVVGSHLDDGSKDLGVLKKTCLSSNSSLLVDSVCFLMDCRQPKSKEVTALEDQIIFLTTNSPTYSLSTEGSIMLGLLQKDFSKVTACSYAQIVSHIEDTRVQLPTDINYLHEILFELHEIGLLLLIKGSSKDSLQIILNASQLTRDVHKLLFSKEGNKSEVAHFPLSNTGAIPEYSISNILPSCDTKNCLFKTGIISEGVISSILPPYITKECLFQLQYCQQISHVQ